MSRDNLEQLTHSADWFDRTYPDREFERLPVLIHPSRVPMWDAVPRQSAPTLTFEKLALLRNSIRGFVDAVADHDKFKDVDTVKANLHQFGLGAAGLEQRWTQDFRTPANRP